MKRVVILRLSAMGDVVQGLGAVQALRRRQPDLQVTWVVQRPFAPLLDGVADVVCHDRGGGPLAYLRTARAIRRLRPDAVLDFQGNWKSAGLQLLSGAPRRIGPAPAMRREPRSALASNELVDLSSDVQPHPARLALAMVRRLDSQVAAQTPRLRAVPAAAIAAEEQALRALGLDTDAPFQVVLLGRDDDRRTWPAAAIERFLGQQPLPTVAVAGPAEADRCAIPRRDGRPLPVLRHARGEIHRLMALGVLCGQRGVTIHGPDQGAAHVLTACGADVRVLFGATSPGRSGPPAAGHLLAAGRPSCAPCCKRDCENPCGPVCMDYTPDEAGALLPPLELPPPVPLASRSST